MKIAKTTTTASIASQWPTGERVCVTHPCSQPQCIPSSNFVARTRWREGDVTVLSENPVSAYLSVSGHASDVRQHGAALNEGSNDDGLRRPQALLAQLELGQLSPRGAP